MKTTLILIAVLVVSSGMYYLLKGDKLKNGEISQSDQKVNEYPQFPIVFENHTKTALTALEGKNVLVFFQPDCDHCQREAKEIGEHLDSFDAYQIYFISNVDFPTMKVFAKDYGLANKSNVQFARAESTDIMTKLGHISAPSLYIFRDRKLIKHLNGETPINEIVEFL